MNTIFSSLVAGESLFFLLTLSIFALLILIYVTGVYAIAQLRQDNSVMDIAYGPAFAVGAWGTMYLTGVWTLPTLILASVITLWAARLSIRIARKNWGKPEDQRYAAWRAAWSKKGTVYFLLRSYIQINLLQGIIIVAVALPMVVVIAHGLLYPDDPLPTIFYLGIGVWLIGWLFESTADWQLDRFLARKRAGTEAATLMTTGLFHYSRRPNYFGEALLWWGLAVAVVYYPFGWLALLSPISITFILTRVTGPMLEEIFLEKYPDAYRAYMARTSYFIPLPPRTATPNPLPDTQTPTI